MNFIIQIVVGILLTLASNLLQQAFSGGQQQNQRRRTGTRGSILIGGRVSQYFLIGTIGAPGKLEYRNTWGTSGEVPNAYLVDVISFGDLPISGLSKVYVNGVECTLDTGNEDASKGYPVEEYRTGGTDHMWIKFYDGTQTTADSYLTSKFGSDSDRPWTSDFVGTGVPYIIATSLWNEQLFTGFPSFLAQVQGVPLYDIRKDTTAGGSGAHRWSDQSTWEASDNSKVIEYNIERGILYDGEHVWGGSAASAQLPYQVWADAMDACDESVSLDAGGSEKRFRGGRKVDFNERPADVIKEFMIGSNSRTAHCSDGQIYTLVGAPGSADGSFDDDDVLALNKLGTIPFPNLDEVINGATATFRAPEQAWEDKETAPYYRSDLEAADDGRRQIEGLNLDTTFSGTQAQRVLKATVEEGRRFIRHVVALPPEYAVYRPLNVLAWTSSRFDYTAKLFLITVRTRDMWGNVVFGLQEIDPDDHDWTPGTDETAIDFSPVVTNRPAPQEVSGFSVAPATVQDSDGTNRRPGIDVFWSSASVAIDVESVRVTIATDDGAGGADTTVIDAPAIRPEIGSARFAGDPLLQNQDYVVQIQYVPRSGRETTASAWLQVTTPNVGLGEDDFAQAVQDRIDYTSTLLRSLQEQLIDMDSTVASQESWSRDIAVKQGNALAAVVRQTEVILENNYASAEDLTLLTARVGNVDAATLLSASATVDEGEGMAEVAWRVRVTDEGEFVEAGIGVGVLGGVGYSFIDADKTFFSGIIYGGDVLEIDTDTGALSIDIPE